MLTHAPPAPEPEAAAAAPPVDAPAPPPARSRRAAAAAAAAVEESPSAVQEAPTAMRSLGQTRADTGIGGPVDVLGPEGLGHQYGGGELDPTVGGLGPMQWENKPIGPPIWQVLYGFFEDFSEWLFRGLQGTVGIFGLSLAQGFGLAIRGGLVLLMAVALVASGMYVGKKYGPTMLGMKEEAPVLPPKRILPPSADTTQSARQAVLDFYSAIDNRAYSVAYDSLSPAWRSELTFDQFERGYHGTQSLRCTVREARRINDQKVELDIGLDVSEERGTQSYTGTYVAVLTDMGWKLDSGKIKH